MINFRNFFDNLGWRVVMASLVLGFGVYVISKGLAFPGWIGAPYFIFGMAAFIVASIIMGLPLAGVVAEFLGNLVYTSEHYRKPQPVYGIPEAKRVKGLFQEAFEDFQKLSQEHPQELRAYIEMIDIALVEMKNPDLASSVYQCGMEVLEKQEAREVLTRKYEELGACI